MQRNTEYNKYTYIHNICTYNISPQLLPTSRSSTKADGNWTDSAPTSNRRTAAEDGKHAENTTKSSPKLTQIRKQRKLALYIALADLHRLITAEKHTKLARNQPMKKCEEIV